MSRETWTLLRDTFARRTLVQEAQLALFEDLDRDAGLLEAWLADERGAPGPGLDVAGVGFFFADGTAPPDPGGGGLPPARGEPPRVLRELRERILARHGGDHLARRREETLAALADLRAGPPAGASLPLEPDRLPERREGIARRTASPLAALFALEVLERPRPLRAEAPREDGEEAARLPGALGVGPPERLRLREARGALLDDAVDLAASRRPDWGTALLLAMARLAAFESSVDAQRFALLDTLPADAATLVLTARRRALLPELAVEARADLDRAWSHFAASPGFREAEWSAFEAAASRWLELRRAQAGAPSIRVQPGPLLPEGRARVTHLPRSRADGVPLSRRLAETRAVQRGFHDALRERHGYHLVLHNCVSEIFRTIEAAFAAGARGAGADAAALRSLARDESERRLGGWVDPVASLNFIPFVSAGHVNRRYSVTERVSLPSQRRWQLAGMAAREPWLRVALRESNPWSARTHQPAEGEGFFVFFTDGAALPRPLLGAVNLGAGLARSALGVIELPLDRGRGLRAGLEGVLWSLPELVFQNVRKGSNEWVRPEERPPAG